MSDTVLGAQVLEHREKQYDLRVRMDVHVSEGGAERVRSCPSRCAPLATGAIHVYSMLAVKKDKAGTTPTEAFTNAHCSGLSVCILVLLVQMPHHVQVAVRGALVFIASHSPANANWLGQASREAIAQQVARAVGPSGPNREYVYRLAAALREVWAQACVGGKWRPVALLPAGAHVHAHGCMTPRAFT